MYNVPARHILTLIQLPKSRCTQTLPAGPQTNNRDHILLRRTHGYISTKEITSQHYQCIKHSLMLIHCRKRLTGQTYINDQINPQQILM